MIPDAILHMRAKLTAAEAEIADFVWNKQADFVQWPGKSVVFTQTSIRQKYHVFTPEQKVLLRTNKITPDTRANGPAIMSFLLAGGIRPTRRNRRGWPIHHIYDGQFPFPGRTVTLHAVKDERYFTESAGLVAIHPVADGLASELPYFAWLLRYRAFELFGFDPDLVFHNIQNENRA
jgi:hypothetical protein